MEETCIGASDIPAELHSDYLSNLIAGQARQCNEAVRGNLALEAFDEVQPFYNCLIVNTPSFALTSNETLGAERDGENAA